MIYKSYKFVEKIEGLFCAFRHHAGCFTFPGFSLYPFSAESTCELQSIYLLIPCHYNVNLWPAICSKMCYPPAHCTLQCWCFWASFVCPRNIRALCLLWSACALSHCQTKLYVFLLYREQLLRAAMLGVLVYFWLQLASSQVEVRFTAQKDIFDNIK